MPARKSAPRHSEDDIERALLMLTLCGGVCAEASRRLAMLEPPLKVVPSTLSDWKAKYRERYADIQAERAPLIEGIVLQQVRDAIIGAGNVQAVVLEELLKRLALGEVDTKDLTAILKAAGVTLGINVEKMLLLTNRPTQITEKRDVNELLASLGKRVPGLIIGDAEVIDDSKGIGEGPD